MAACHCIRVADRVKTADAGFAKATLSAEPHDVVLSDIMLPGSLNGVQLAFRLRERRPGLPLILVTGYAPAHG